MAENTIDNESKRRRKGRLKPVEVEEVDVEGEDYEDDDADDSRGITAGKGRPTPSRRNTQEVEKAAEGGNFITRTLYSIRDYFEGVNSELRKVSWPTRQDVRSLTIIVLATTILASIILGLIGLGFTELFRLGLTTPTIFLVFFIIVGAIAFVIYRRTQNQNISPY